MAKYDGPVRTASHSQTDGPSQFSGDRWTPRDHVGKLHLFASQPNLTETIETQYGETEVAIADVVVVFEDDRKTWNSYQSVYVFPVVLKNAVLEGGVVGGTVSSEKTAAGNDVWVLGDLDADDSEVVNQWVAENLNRADDGRLHLGSENENLEGAGGNNTESDAEAF